MSSDLSFSGSCERDLLKSKVWLCQHLPVKTYNKVYVLGSWYGNMGLILRYMGVNFKSIVNVDLNAKYCRDTDKIYKLAGFDRPYQILNKDCNGVDCSDADLVINNSTNDIERDIWFDCIPYGCLVAIQCRNHQPDSYQKDRPDSFKEFKDMFEFEQIIYQGKMTLKNSEEHYQRYMIIGNK